MENNKPQVEKYTLDSEELAGLIRATLADGTTISFNAPGHSMLPFIHSGDKIFVSPIDRSQIRLGDILVYVHPRDGKVLAHRLVCAEDEKLLCKGDNVNLQSDGWISFADVLGRVSRIERNGKSLHLGLGPERRLIARLSRERKLVPILNFYRRYLRWLSKNKKI